MKKILFYVTLVTFMSCGKEYCWKCTVTSRAPSVIRYPYDSTQITTVVCEKTKKEIKEYEENGTMTTTSSNGVPIVTTTECEIKYQ